MTSKASRTGCRYQHRLPQERSMIDTATELREIFAPDDSSIVLALLNKAEALTARCAAMEAALLKYGYHHESCDFVQSELPCTCGLEVLRSSVADGEQHG
jgi:hypothetical protein